MPSVAREPWFAALEDADRARILAGHEHERARTAELDARHKGSLLRSPIPAAVTFAIADLFSPWTSTGTVLGAAVVGGAFGLLAHAMEFGRLRSSSLGMVAFLAFECATRGGFAGRVFFTALVLGVAMAWQGWRREESTYCG